VFGIGADLGQSIAQFLNITVSRWPAEADPEARRLADAIAASSASNGRVVVIAHSQGNLMAGEALGILKNRAGFDTRCLGFVSIAPPASIPVAGTGATLNSMIIDGVFVDDVLLLLPTTPLAIGSTPRVTNALSRFYDAFSVLYLLQPYGSLLRAYAGLQLHSIDGSYLTEDGTRERTVTALQTVSSAVNASCPTPRVKSVSVEPNVAILAPSKTVRATATVNADAGVAQTVTWQSSNTTVATVDATGLITAKTIGTAVITAASTVDPTVTGSLALTVRPIQAAVVSIQTITVADNPTIPVNLGNVSGSIDVNLLIDSGDETVTGAGIYLDGVEVNRSNLTITGLRSLVLSFNTGALGPTTGRLRFCNGPHTLSTKIFVQDGPALGVAGPTASMTFNNSGPACSGSSPTVLFTDNFSSGLGGWTIRGTGGSWTTANGVVTGVYDYVCGSSGCSQSQLVLNTDIAALSSWSAEIRFTQSFYAKYNRYLAQAALILWVSENEKTQLGVAEGATGSPLPATLSQIGYSVQRFPWTQLAGARPNVSSWVPAAWNTLKISKSANEYRLYFNDQLLTTQTLSFSAPPKIGLSVYGQSVFDDFKLVTP
jgi:hypothetical protein